MDPAAQAHAEEAIHALAQDDAPSARTAVAQAYEADRRLSALADIVYLACAELEDEGQVTTSTWNALADAVGSNHLIAVVENSRTH